MEKKLIQKVEAIKHENANERVEVCAVDEARIGLQPILRRVWAQIHERPLAKVEPRYEWLWLYAAVHPASGVVFWLILPSLNSKCVQIFLDEFAKVHCQNGKQIVLVWDGAPAHRARAVMIPKGITIMWLPPYTPELNPSERLWSKVKEVATNKHYETLDDLENKIAERCICLSEEKSRIRAMTRYYWWNFD